MRGEAAALRDPSDGSRFAATVPDRGEATKVAVIITDPTGRRAKAVADVVLA